MGGLASAWLVGTGLVIWRQVHAEHHMPVPGTLLAVTGIFALMGATAEVFPQTKTLITVTAWGLDVAGVLNLWPHALGGQVQAAAANEEPPAGPVRSGGGHPVQV